MHWVQKLRMITRCDNRQKQLCDNSVMLHGDRFNIFFVKFKRYLLFNGFDIFASHSLHGSRFDIHFTRLFKGSSGGFMITEVHRMRVFPRLHYGRSLRPARVRGGAVTTSRNRCAHVCLFLGQDGACSKRLWPTHPSRPHIQLVEMSNFKPIHPSW